MTLRWPRLLLAAVAAEAVPIVVFVALRDAGLLIAQAVAFQWLFVVSGLGRVVAGALGGYLAQRRSLTDGAAA